MYTINFNKPIHIHFIGIGGIAMAGVIGIIRSWSIIIIGRTGSNDGIIYSDCSIC